MDIILISPEIYPFVRIGGLADVSFDLARILRERGHTVRMITPKYRGTEEAGYPLTRTTGPITIKVSLRELTAQPFVTSIEGGVEVHFIACDELFDRFGVYGTEFGDYQDNAERYIFFCHACLELIKQLDLRPDIIHCHEWQTGLVPAYVKTLYASEPCLAQAALVYTFHNLGVQGLFAHYDFTGTGLSWEYFSPDCMEHKGRLNFAKAGLNFADIINTVSHNYQQEALDESSGFGLEETLRDKQDRYHAVLNGIDYRTWDPALDAFIPANYSPADLAGKSVCRRELMKLFNLEPSPGPVLAFISRFYERKGLSLVNDLAPWLMEQELRLILCGQGQDRFHGLAAQLAERYPGRVGVHIGYDRGLIHNVVAGADILLMPSLFEPCGLEQFYGLRYGAVPVARATGGLEETIGDFDGDHGRGVGFKFHDATATALGQAVSRALAVWRRPEQWAALVKRGMAQDFSITKTVNGYEELYALAVQRDQADHV